MLAFSNVSLSMQYLFNIGECNEYGGWQHANATNKCCSHQCFGKCGAANCKTPDQDLKCCFSDIPDTICSATNPAPCSLGIKTLSLRLFSSKSLEIEFNLNVK